MNLTRAAVAASLATVVLWTLKAVAIAVAGGNGRSPLEGPLFLLGLVTGVVATVCVGAGLAGPRGVLVRVVGALVALVVVSVVGGVVQALAASGPRPAWWRVELNLWVVMLLVLAGAFVLRARVQGRAGWRATSIPG